MTLTSDTRGYEQWTHRFAVATLVCALPLVLFGGSVTTLGAGMAVEGWLIAEGHFLLVFPIEKWFRDLPTFVEHSHRLFGALVGVCALAACASAFLRNASRTVRRATLLSLGLVCAQGALGGFRVLENSPQLAFLHGAFAQCVFAVVACTAALASRGWAALQPHRSESLRGVWRLALAATAVVFVQVVIGAWYRHGLRPEPLAAIAGRLHLHLLGAMLVFAFVAALSSRLLAAAADSSTEPALRDRLVRDRKWLVHLLGLQVTLGVIAWFGFRPDGIGAIEWLSSILHVLGGAVLLSRVLLLTLRTHHLGALGEAAAVPQEFASGSPA